MPSHMSTIGLPVESEEDFISFAEKAAAKSEKNSVRGGTYLRWTCSSGAELWLQTDDEQRIVAMTPHFAGPSTMRVGLTTLIRRPDEAAMDGAFHGWAAPTDEEDPESGEYPFVFDSPNFLATAAMELPAVRDVQIAAFAHEVEYFDSPEALEQSQEEGMKMAPESFIPVGLFADEEGKEEDIKPPEAYALLCGLVEQSGEKTNSLGKGTFYWAQVRTLGGQVDVVIDPEVGKSLPPVGGILKGAFWLSGRILSFGVEPNEGS